MFSLSPPWTFCVGFLSCRKLLASFLLITALLLSLSWLSCALFADDWEKDHLPSNGESEQASSKSEKLKQRKRNGISLFSQKEFNGRIIRNIQIEIRDIFENPDNFIYRSANDLKIGTKEHVISQEFLFAEGQAYDEFRVRETERVLRTLRFLRDAHIVAEAVGQDMVDIQVSVQDTWTFIPQMSFSSGDGRNRTSYGIAESNLLGYGNRLEGLVENDDGRTSASAVLDSRRFMRTPYDLTAAYIDRSDGERNILGFGSPMRSLLDDKAWVTAGEVSDTVGRLFYGGDERYIFQQSVRDFDFRYTIATGDREKQTRRFSFGYRYLDKDFSQATLEDYENLDLDPEEVSNDLAQVPEDRRFSGPTFHYQMIEPDFVPMRYIDRFERTEDYNLGEAYNFTAHLAPKELGSLENAAILSWSLANGKRLGAASFLRGEATLSTRAEESEHFENTVFSFELKGYSVLGPVFLGDFYLGKHTLASNFYVDYGQALDLEREFLVGGDNALRGYEARSFSGDKRMVLNLEDRAHLVENIYDLISVGTATFIDVGGATFDSFGNLLEEDLYGNIGAGLRVAFPKSSGERVVRLDVAFPFRDGPDGSSAWEPRFLVSGGQLFGSPTRAERVGAEKASLELGFDR